MPAGLPDCPRYASASGNPQSPLLADDHQLDAFAEARDHAAHPKTDGARRAHELSNILPSVVQPV
jgi:hypothetical protein